MMVTVGLDADAADFVSPAVAVEPWDTQPIIFTSGTTGPSKGVLSSYAHLYSSCTAAFHGSFVFVDRLRDMIRRRGENISSYEVEAQALLHTGVREAAAVAVSGDDGESEVLLIVSATGTTVDPVELCLFLQAQLAHFMVPRYVRIVEAIPLTATNKPRKDILRLEGMTAATCDRHASALKVRMERVR